MNIEKELRRKFKTPGEAIKALGLDEKLLAIDSMENMDMDKNVSQKRKVAAVDALTAYLSPMMAKDAKLDMDKLAVLAMDAWPPEKEDDDDKKDKKAEDDFPEKEDDDDDKKKAKDKKAKDMKAAKDKKAKDEDPEEAMDAEEDDDEEEKKEKKADDKKAKDMKASDKKAMDEVEVKKAMDEAIAGERARQRDVREAERFVRPWIGDLKIAFDSADEVYKAALEARGKSVKDIHPSAYRAILEMLPKPGSEKLSQTRVAMDSVSAKGYAERFPDAARIGHA